MRGSIVTLRPLTLADADTLWELIGDDQDTWRWVGSGAPVPRTVEDLRIEFARKLARQGAEFFAIVDNTTEQVIGSTAFIDIRPKDHHFEIGSSFIAPAFRGGKRNLEAKFLMLSDAFENRDAVRVTIKANEKNIASRKAIEKLGAKLEGLLRNQRQERDGTWRTAAYYSVIVEEWPETKSQLNHLLESATSR
jgi:RimJ/RimL family protein N-acetyltransferase